MLRLDNVICGTSTTGTGTLTLAATPSGVDAMDLYTAFAGMGLGTAAGIPISYEIIEYTDNTYTKPLQTEKGIGLLTLGASITATTLARTTVQTTQTALSTTPAFTFNAPAAITIGTAANVLVFIGSSALDTISVPPWTDVTGMPGIMPMSVNIGANGTHGLTSGQMVWFPFLLGMPVVGAVLRTIVSGTYTGGTSNLWGALYKAGSNGRPGKLIADFGVLGTAGSSLSSASIIASASLATPPLLVPGHYFVGIEAAFSGGTGTPSLVCKGVPVLIGVMGLQSSGIPQNFATSTGSGASTDFTDPATLTSYSPTATYNAYPALTIGAS